MKELLIKNREEIIKILLKDVYYFQTPASQPHVVTVVTKKGQLPIRGTSLTEMAELLPRTFYRCHQRFLVNLRKIQQIQTKDRQIYFNSKNIPAIYYSRRKRHEIIQAWSETTST